MHEERDKEHAERCTDHAKRHKARLDKILRVMRRNDGSHHEAHDGKREVVLHGVDRLRTRNILEHKQEHLGKSPEHRESDNGGTERAVTPAKAQAAAGNGELDVLVVVLDLRDKETRDRTEHAHRNENPGNHDRLRNNDPDSLVAHERLKVDKVHANDGKPARGDYANQGENLQESVRVAQVVDSEHFTDDRVLCRAMDRKTRRQADRKPESHSRAVTGDKDRLGDNK